MTVPNLLSLGRIVLSPVLGYLVISSNFSVALGLFAVAGLSDIVSFKIIALTIGMLSIM